MNLFGWFASLGYPHWMMVIAAVVLVFGFIGSIFSQNKNAWSDAPKAKEKPPEVSVKE